MTRATPERSFPIDWTTFFPPRNNPSPFFRVSDRMLGSLLGTFTIGQMVEFGFREDQLQGDMREAFEVSRDSASDLRWRYIKEKFKRIETVLTKSQPFFRGFRNSPLTLITLYSFTPLCRKTHSTSMAAMRRIVRMPVMPSKALEGFCIDHEEPRKILSTPELSTATWLIGF